MDGWTKYGEKSFGWMVDKGLVNPNGRLVIKPNMLTVVLIDNIYELSVAVLYVNHID